MKDVEILFGRVEEGQDEDRAHRTDIKDGSFWIKVREARLRLFGQVQRGEQ